jgi:hypothetical protein
MQKTKLIACVLLFAMWSGISFACPCDDEDAAAPASADPTPVVYPKPQQPTNTD